jgi:hypothetical protein
MATEQTPSPLPASAPPWFARLGLSGMLLTIGGLAGVIVAFLPLASVAVEVGGAGGNPFGMLGGGQVQLPGMTVNKTVMVVEDWRGKVGLAGYLAALLLAFMLYPPHGLRQKPLAWAGVSVGLLSVALAIWLLVLAFDSGGASPMGITVRAAVGVGAYLNVLAGAAVAAGGFLKAREEKLI